MIVVRDAAPADYPVCAAIFEAAWNEAFPHAARVVGVAELLAQTSDEAVIVALRDGRVRGLASIYLPDSFLHHLFVDPASRGQGVGSVLLRAAMARADAPLSLKCQLANTRALAFYGAHDFIEGERGDDDDGAWVRLHSRR
jgi:GNAT superfamily N-acetyltransferase